MTSRGKSTSTGALVTAFKAPAINGEITDMQLSNGKLFSAFMVDGVKCGPDGVRADVARIFRAEGEKGAVGIERQRLLEVPDALRGVLARHDALEHQLHPRLRGDSRVTVLDSKRDVVVRREAASRIREVLWGPAGASEQ